MYMYKDHWAPTIWAQKVLHKTVLWLQILFKGEFKNYKDDYVALLFLYPSHKMGCKRSPSNSVSEDNQSETSPKILPKKKKSKG